MKSLILTSLIAFLFAINTQAQDTKKILKFKVLGNCEMCKKTIENSLDVKGIKSANWNVDTKIIEVTYLSDKINEDKIYDLVAASGYDSEKKKGDDNAYKALPECCQYSRK